MLILPESNLNSQSGFIMEKLRDSAEAHCDNGRFFAMNTPNYPTPKSIKQPGGVATVVQGKYMSRFAGVEYDPAGRWIVHKYFGKKSFLKIYAVYRVCRQSKKAGETTAWVQQSTFFSTKGKDINPRSKIVEDLKKSIEIDLENNCEIIVAGDLNEDIGDDPSMAPGAKRTIADHLGTTQR